MKSVLFAASAPRLHLALLVAPGAKAAAIYRGSGGVARISGEIKVGDYEELKAARPGLRQSSQCDPKGRHSEAIRMAELIHANGSARRTVRDYCLSACYPLPAARTRTIPDGAVVAFMPVPRRPRVWGLLCAPPA